MIAVHFPQFLAQIALQSFQDFHIDLGIKAAYTRPVMSKAYFRAARGRQQHQPDVHKLVLHRVRGVAQQEETTLLFGHYCTADFCAFFGAGCPHAGKGCREELRKAMISSRTFPRRAMIASTSFSSAAQSLPVHSGGMLPAIS